MLSGGLHHLHLRRRGKHGLEPFPSREPFKRFLDRFMFVVAFMVPVALIPQVVDIYTKQNAQGLTLVTWVLLTAGNMLWALYGLVHRDKPIIVANVLVTLLNIAVIVGILKYGG